MDFTTLKNRIKQEKQTGDIKKAADRAGYSRTVFDSAMRKNSSEELTPAETAVVYHIIEVLNERKVQKERIKNYS